MRSNRGPALSLAGIALLLLFALSAAGPADDGAAIPGTEQPTCMLFNFAAVPTLAVPQLQARDMLVDALQASGICRPSSSGADADVSSWQASIVARCGDVPSCLADAASSAGAALLVVGRIDAEQGEPNAASPDRAQAGFSIEMSAIDTHARRVSAVWKIWRPELSAAVAQLTLDGPQLVQGQSGLDVPPLRPSVGVPLPAPPLRAQTTLPAPAAASASSLAQRDARDGVGFVVAGGLVFGVGAVVAAIGAARTVASLDNLSGLHAKIDGTRAIDDATGQVNANAVATMGGAIGIITGVILMGIGVAADETPGPSALDRAQ